MSEQDYITKQGIRYTADSAPVSQRREVRYTSRAWVRARSYGPLRPNVTSSIKPEVHITYRNAAGGGPSHGHRDLHTKFRADRSSGSRDMLADRQTHRDTLRERQHLISL